MTDSVISELPVERFVAQRRRAARNAVAASCARTPAKSNFAQYRTRLWANVVPLTFSIAVATILWIGWGNRQDSGITRYSGGGYWLASGRRRAIVRRAALSLAKAHKTIAAAWHGCVLVPCPHDPWHIRACIDSAARKFPAWLDQQQCSPRGNACCCHERDRWTVSLWQDPPRTVRTQSG